MVFPSLLHLVFGLGLWLPLPDPMPSHTLATLYCAFPFTFPKWSETDTSQPKLKSHPLLLFCSEPLTAPSTSGSFPTPKPESGAQVTQQATHKPRTSHTLQLSYMDSSHLPELKTRTSRFITSHDSQESHHWLLAHWLTQCMPDER